MKTTPFYELSVALRGRSIIFQSIVIAAFVLSFTISLLGASQAFSNRSKTITQATHRSSVVVNADATAQALVK